MSSTPGLINLTEAELDVVLCMKLMFGDTYRRIAIAISFNQKNPPLRFKKEDQYTLAAKIGKQVRDTAAGLAPKELNRHRFWIEDEWSDDDVEKCYQRYKSGIDRFLGNIVDEDDAYWDVQKWPSLEAREKEKDRRAKFMKTEMGRMPEL
ncbi:MAG: hypothetical protein Q9183_006094, partial [Haloplaca sp. 2 TL-2023]